MGYGCTTKASYTLDAIGKLIVGVMASNGMPDGGFWERGREQRDGAITGTVWKPYAADPSRVEKRGGFRIEPDGTVKCFPGLPRTLLHQAETDGTAAFKATHGTWRERGAALLTGLESGTMNGKLSWLWFVSIFNGWQREHRIMFAAMPTATDVAMAAALRGMLSETK